MGHSQVWQSHPRKYGKGSREWWVALYMWIFGYYYYCVWPNNQKKLCYLLLVYLKFSVLCSAIIRQTVHSRSLLFIRSRTCGNRWGIIRKYHLNMCRQCFKQYAHDIGFEKVRIHPFRVFILPVSNFHPSLSTAKNCCNDRERCVLGVYLLSQARHDL